MVAIQPLAVRWALGCSGLAVPSTRRISRTPKESALRNNEPTLKGERIRSSTNVYGNIVRREISNSPEAVSTKSQSEGSAPKADNRSWCRSSQAKAKRSSGRERSVEAKARALVCSFSNNTSTKGGPTRRPHNPDRYSLSNASGRRAASWNRQAVLRTQVRGFNVLSLEMVITEPYSWSSSSEFSAGFSDGEMQMANSPFTACREAKASATVEAVPSRNSS